MIIVIEGPAKSGKSLIANALRNHQIAQRKGALLIDEQSDAELKPQIEKLINGVALGDKPDLATLPWKAEPLIVVVGKQKARLAEIERLLPGFTAKFGPVTTVTTAK